jgi:hypothetical protein
MEVQLLSLVPTCQMEVFQLVITWPCSVSPTPHRDRGPIPANPRVSALPGFHLGPPENPCSIKPYVEVTPAQYPLIWSIPRGKENSSTDPWKESRATCHTTHGRTGRHHRLRRDLGRSWRRRDLGRTWRQG